jgi:hypothetical protein
MCQALVDCDAGSLCDVHRDRSWLAEDDFLIAG